MGKTSLVVRFTRQQFDGETQVSISAACTQAVIGGKNCDIWDTAGQERFSNIVPMYYRNASAIVLVFDLNSVQSFERAKWWFAEVRRTTKVCVLLVGNKADLQQRVKEQDISYFVSSNKLEYFRCSCKTADSVREVFERAAQELPVDAQGQVIAEEEEEKKGCC